MCEYVDFSSENGCIVEGTLDSDPKKYGEDKTGCEKLE